MEPVKAPGPTLYRGTVSTVSFRGNPITDHLNVRPNRDMGSGHLYGRTSLLDLFDIRTLKLRTLDFVIDMSRFDTPTPPR